MGISLTSQFTRARSLHVIPMGALLLDTFGMRELQFSDCEAGVAATFADISEWAQHCRFVEGKTHVLI